jgi:hypothetical protein
MIDDPINLPFYYGVFSLRTCRLAVCPSRSSEIFFLLFPVAAQLQIVPLFPAILPVLSGAYL